LIIAPFAAINLLMNFYAAFMVVCKLVEQTSSSGKCNGCKLNCFQVRKYSVVECGIA